MANILYLSLTGMTEPLGESQVVQYLVELAKNHSIYLLSFEKPTDKAAYERMETQLRAANIQWKFLPYSNRYGVLSSAIQVISAVFMSATWIKKEKIQVVHARSLIPAVMGLLLRTLLGVKLLFDIRGFAIDEKIQEGRLKPSAWLTRFLKKIEGTVYKQSDHIVTLTHTSKPIIAEKYGVKASLITVIPTCANVDLFKPTTPVEKAALKKECGFAEQDILIMHNGSLNSWVDFEAEIALFKQLFLLDSKVKFLLLNKGQHALIEECLAKHHIEKDQYKLFSVPFDKVGHYLTIADVCVFFIKPSFAKQASAPTKFAELVACHLYSITNTQYGDMEYYLNSHRVGLLFDLADVHAHPSEAAGKVLDLIKHSSNTHADDFNRLFAQHFSRQIAVERYEYIYDDLIKERV